MVLKNKHDNRFPGRRSGLVSLALLFKANGVKSRHRNRRQPLECGGL